MTIFRRVEFSAPFFFSPSTADGVECFASRTGSCREKNTDNNGIWDYVCRQSVLSMYAKQERSTLCQGIDPRFTCSSGLKMVTVLTELPWHHPLGYFICFKGKMFTLVRKYHARCGRVCVCVCSSSFHVSNHWTDFHEILCECCVSVVPLQATSSPHLLVSYNQYW